LVASPTLSLSTPLYFRTPSGVVQGPLSCSISNAPSNLGLVDGAAPGPLPESTADRDVEPASTMRR
jgi:hypothetical protein